MSSPDLSILFDPASAVAQGAAALVLVSPLAIVLSGFALWRTGGRGGRSLMVWAMLYFIWLTWPHPLDPDLKATGMVLSVMGWFWLIGAWAKGARWHEPLLLAANGIALSCLITLTLLAGIATVRDSIGKGIPAQGE